MELYIINNETLNGIRYTHVEMRIFMTASGHSCPRSELSFD